MQHLRITSEAFSEEVEILIFDKWIESALNQRGRCDVKAEHLSTGGVEIAGQPAAGYVATVEKCGDEGAFSVLLRPIGLNGEPQQLLWILDFNASIHAYSIWCAKVKSAEFDDRFLPKSYLNSAYSGLWISRLAASTAPHRKILGLDVDFVWKSRLYPSDDETSKGMGLRLADLVVNDFKGRLAEPLQLSDAWSRHILGEPKIAIHRKP